MGTLLHSDIKFRVSSNKFTFQFLPAFNPIFQIDQNPPTTTIGEEFYTAIQTHGHVPGEHPLNGIRYPFELHFVFGATDGSTLAVGFAFRLTEGKSHKIIRDLLSGTPTRFPNPPPGEDFYMYTGSLTTPPTDTNINWQVWKNQFCINQRDLDSLVENAMVQNARALQSRRGRLVALAHNKS